MLGPWSLPILLGAIAVVLAGGVVRVLKAPPPAVETDSRPGAAAPAADAGSEFSPDAGHVTSVLPSPLEDFAEIVERPLFSRSRRPVAASPSGASAPALSVAAETSLSITGVVIRGPSRLALVLAQGSTQPVRVAVGEEVGGWKVEAIEPNRVVVNRGDRTVDLTFPDRNAQAAPPRPRQPQRGQVAGQRPPPGQKKPSPQQQQQQRQQQPNPQGNGESAPTNPEEAEEEQ